MEAEAKLRQFATLYKISSLLTSAMNVDEILARIAQTAVEQVGVKACSVRLYDEETGQMILKAAYGLSDDYINKGPIIVWKSAVRDAVMKGEVVYVEDVSSDPRVQYPEHAVREGIRSMLCFGLMADGKPIGSMSIYADGDRRFSDEEVSLLQSIANHAGLAIQKARYYESIIEMEKLGKELEIASAIQESLLPKEAPEFDGFAIAGRNLPSEKVGGDYFDIIKIDDTHIGLAIADVSGKSVSGAIIMASARAALRVNIENIYRVQDIITKLNKFLTGDRPSYEFITLFYGVIDTETRIMTYTNAGHDPPLLFRDESTIELWHGGPLLGVFRDALYTENQIQLQPGDLIFLYTDGIIEALNENLDMFGEENLIQTVSQSRHLPPEEILDRIFDSVRTFTGDEKQGDDRTALVVKVLGNANGTTL